MMKRMKFWKFDYEALHPVASFFSIICNELCFQEKFLLPETFSIYFAASFYFLYFWLLNLWYLKSDDGASQPGETGRIPWGAATEGRYQ